MWNNLSRVLFLLGVLAAGLAAWLYWGYSERLRETQRELEERNAELTLEIARLKEHVVYLTNRLDEEVAKLSKEKEEEVARARATHDEMLKTLEKEVERGQVTITQLADRLSVNIVDKILFPSGQDDITEEGRKVLKRVGDVLFQVKDKTFRVVGHTDNVPTGKALRDRYPTNWELAAARATNVVRFLQEEAGIDPATLEAVALGEYHPIASNRTPEGRSQNRRIEILLYPRVASLVKELPLKKPAAPAGKPAPNRAPASAPRPAQP
ncbi:MAG TPA: flagellar motor protein MotB [Acidiferrobacterales bacterium]|jgi:chemotaxis protein MotB